MTVVFLFTPSIMHNELVRAGGVLVGPFGIMPGKGAAQGPQ
jgi:hypothetical protein